MRKNQLIFSAAVMAAVATGATHLLSTLTDSFSVVNIAGRYYKIFIRGWPMSYIASGEFREPWAEVTGIIALNFLVLWVLCVAVLWIFIRTYATIRRRKQK